VLYWATSTKVGGRQLQFAFRRRGKITPSVLHAASQSYTRRCPKGADVHCIDTQAAWALLQGKGGKGKRGSCCTVLGCSLFVIPPSVRRSSANDGRRIAERAWAEPGGGTGEAGGGAENGGLLWPDWCGHQPAPVLEDDRAAVESKELDDKMPYLCHAASSISFLCYGV